jgi:hypothetical protein
VPTLAAGDVRYEHLSAGDKQRKEGKKEKSPVVGLGCLYKLKCSVHVPRKSAWSQPLSLRL